MRVASPRGLVVGGLLALGAIFVVLAFVIGGSDSNLPAGWKSFSAGPYRGAVQDGWIVAYVDFARFDPKSLPEGIPDDYPDKLASMKAAGAVKSILLVFYNADPVFAPTINILSCEPAGSVDLIDSTTDVINLYGKNFIKADVVGSVVYNSRQFDLIQLFQQPQYDSYQAYLKTEDCYTAVNMATASGDKAPLEPFQFFLSNLTIDATQLK